MWNCPVCEAEIDDDEWETCWRCSSLKSADPDEVLKERLNHQKRVERSLSCLRCETRLTYDGTRTFRQDAGFEFQILGFNLGARRDRYDVYHCPNCGRLEFFVDGIGDDKRGEADD